MKFGKTANNINGFFIDFPNGIRAKIIFSEDGEVGGIMTYTNYLFKQAFMGLNPVEFAHKLYQISTTKS